MKHYSFVKLIIVGVAGILCYLLCYYFLISTDINISKLYMGSVFCGFASVVLSATFMVCLEEITTFQHFFQALSVFNILHMVIGGVAGAAAYSRGMSYYVADNMARYGASVDRVALSRNPLPLGEYIGEFVERMMEISIKQIYGWTIFACIFLLLLFLLYDAPMRRELKKMPTWKGLRKEIASHLRW